MCMFQESDYYISQLYAYTQKTVIDCAEEMEKFAKRTQGFVEVGQKSKVPDYNYRKLALSKITDIFKKAVRKGRPDYHVIPCYGP